MVKGEIGRLRNKGTITQSHHGARHEELVHKHGGLVHAPIAIGVLEAADAAHRLIFTSGSHVLHVATHFTHKEPALIIPTDRHGRLDHGLGGDQFHAIAWCDPQSLEFLLRVEHGRRREIKLQLRLLRPPVTLLGGRRCRRFWRFDSLGDCSDTEENGETETKRAHERGGEWG